MPGLVFWKESEVDFVEGAGEGDGDIGIDPPLGTSARGGRFAASAVTLVCADFMAIGTGTGAGAVKMLVGTAAPRLIPTSRRTIHAVSGLRLK